jgi:hypothetical protein
VHPNPARTEIHLQRADAPGCAGAIDIASGLRCRMSVCAASCIILDEYPVRVGEFALKWDKNCVA